MTITYEVRKLTVIEQTQNEKSSILPDVTMDPDISIVWVLLIIVIGVGLSVYSICKGCKGLQGESPTAPTSFMAPYAHLLQHIRAEARRQHQEQHRHRDSVGTVSAELDKNPPTYEELFAPLPPSYDETIKLERTSKNTQIADSKLASVDRIPTTSSVSSSTANEITIVVMDHVNLRT